jgi:peptide deformylase
MSPLTLIQAPDPIFKQKALAVTLFDDELKHMVEAMFDVLYHHQGVGIGANMVGVLKRIIIIDLHPNGISTPLVFINPEVEVLSDEVQTFTEASLSFPGISAEITRPKQISLTYQTLTGANKNLKLEGWLATVVQHELDYLNGQTFLDHLSLVKRNNLLRKYKKYLKIA